MGSFQPLSGFYDDVRAARMADLDARCWAWARSLGYAPVRLPLVEARDLFERGVGNGTDVVDKEMLALEDGDRVLRPEGTAGAMRAWLNAGGRSLGAVRWAYSGPMFRNERPQAGRFRQFQQFGLEAIGASEGLVDVELLVATNDLFVALGVRERLTLRLNTLGTADERAAYRTQLAAFLRERLDDLDELSQVRSVTNPLRVWDSKDAGTQAVMRDAPRLMDALGEASRTAWTALISTLDGLGVAYVVDPGLMRGLDHYNGTVFEWVTDESKAQNAVAAGGRYDGLAAQLGGDPTPAFGLAVGLERVLMLMEATKPDRDGYYVAWMGGSLERTMALRTARWGRLQGRAVTLDDGGRKLGKQIARANELNARFLVVIGEQEREAGMVTVKDLLDGSQTMQRWA